MMDLRIRKQRREELVREAKQSRLAMVLRGSRRQRGASRTSAMAWELKRRK